MIDWHQLIILGDKMDNDKRVKGVYDSTNTIVLLEINQTLARIAYLIVMGLLAIMWSVVLSARHTSLYNLIVFIIFSLLLYGIYQWIAWKERKYRENTLKNIINEKIENNTSN